MVVTRMCWKLLTLLLCVAVSLTSPTPPAAEEGEQTVQQEYMETMESPQPPEQEAVEVVGMEYILHAGGVTPRGAVGSNSLEALDWSYARGYRAIEMDFCWTSDGEPVCVHDWTAYYSAFTGGEVPSLAEFEALRSGAYGYTSMTLEHLAQWMEDHADVRIITDIKENNVEGAALIAQRYPHLQDRFVLQIYHPDEYEPVARMGFSDIILTVYQMTWAEKTDTAALTAFLAEHPLLGLTFPVELIEQPGYLDALLDTGTPLYVHTVNEREEQQEMFRMGLSGVYTDTGANPESNEGST